MLERARTVTQRRRCRVGIAALVVLGYAARASGAGFVDPLDAPAVRTALAPRSRLTAVVAIGDTLVAAGERGHVIVSRDRGESWRQAAVPVSTDLTSLWFVTPRRGWAAGHGGVVLSTDDGGSTWVKRLDRRDVQRLLRAWAPAQRGARVAGLAEQLEILTAEDADVSFLDVWFQDEATGYVVGAFNLVLRTDDGGRSWTPWLHRTPNPQALHLHAMRRVGGRVYLVGERGLLLALDRDGERFEALPLAADASLFGVTGDERAVVVFGLSGRAWRSRDAGRSWEPLSTGSATTLGAGAALGDGRLVLAARAGDLLVSRDRGESFVAVRAQSAIGVSALTAVGQDAVLVCGPRGVRVVRVP